jgi:hypothetical protein
MQTENLPEAQTDHLEQETEDDSLMKTSFGYYNMKCNSVI